MVVDEIGWGPLIAVALSLLGTAVGYGDNRQRNKRTAEDVEGLRRVAEQGREELAEYKLLIARNEYARRDDLREIEGRLRQQIDRVKDDLSDKIDDLKQDFGKRNIENTITTAIDAALYPTKVRGGQEPNK